MSKRLYIASLFVVTLLPFTLVHAVSGDTRPAEYAAADKELNKTYMALMKQLRTEDQENLKKAQRLWIALREADCKWASPAEPLDCMIERTEHRTAELKGSMFRATNGEYISLELQK